MACRPLFVNQHNAYSSSQGDFLSDMRREAFPMLCQIINDGSVTADIRRLFQSFIDSTDVSWMIDSLEHLNTHLIVDPSTEERRPVSGLALAKSSMYFDRLIAHSVGKQLPLPFSELSFLGRGIAHVIEFVNSDGKRLNVTDENCVDLYLTADFVMLETMRTDVLNFIVSRCAANLGLALIIWSTHKSLHLPELTTSTLEQILAHFDVAREQPAWLQLSPDDLLEIVSNDGLNCRSELHAFDSVATWLTFDWSGRSSLGQQLLSQSVRANLLSQQQVQLLSQHELLSHYTELRERLLSSGWSETPRMSRQPHEAALVFGGWCQEEGPRAACQAYDPRANTWTLWSPSQSQPVEGIGQIERRVYAGCVLVGDVVHLVGGYDGHSALKTVACYNVRTRSGWYEGSCMHSKRYYVCCAQLNGCVYAIGGHTGDNHTGRLSSVERLVVRDNSWTQVASLRMIRSDAGAAALGSKVFVAGGFDGRNYHDSAEVYDPELDQWTLISRMNSPRGGVALVAFDNVLYAIGGNDGNGRLAVIEKYQEEADGWLFAGRLNRRKSNLSATVIDNGILIIGGWSDEREVGILSSAEMFDPISETSANMSDMRFPASATSTCTISGRHLVSHFLRSHEQAAEAARDQAAAAAEDDAVASGLRRVFATSTESQSQPSVEMADEPMNE